MDFEYLDNCEHCGEILTIADKNVYITCCIKCGEKIDEDENTN